MSISTTESHGSRKFTVEACEGTNFLDKMKLAITQNNQRKTLTQQIHVRIDARSADDPLSLPPPREVADASRRMIQQQTADSHAQRAAAAAARRFTRVGQRPAARRAADDETGNDGTGMQLF